MFDLTVLHSIAASLKDQRIQVGGGCSQELAKIGCAVRVHSAALAIAWLFIHVFSLESMLSCPEGRVKQMILGHVVRRAGLH